MAHEVPWNKIILERFIELACLTKSEESIMRTRVAGWTRDEQADHLGMSKSNVDKLIRSCKDKYDAVQKYDPILPPRKYSSQEFVMDNNLKRKKKKK